MTSVSVSVTTDQGQDLFVNYISDMKTKAITAKDNEYFVVDMNGQNRHSVASTATSGIRVQGTIANQPVDLLVDCGADISVFSLNLVTRLAIPIKATTATMRGADGRPIECAGYVTCTLHCDGMDPLHLTALVASHLHDSGLLGCDFLSKYKAVIDFSTRSMQLQPSPPVPADIDKKTILVRRLVQAHHRSLPAEDMLNEISSWVHLHAHKQRLILSALVGLPIEGAMELMSLIKAFMLRIPLLVSKYIASLTRATAIGKPPEQVAPPSTLARASAVDEPQTEARAR